MKTTFFKIPTLLFILSFLFYYKTAKAQVNYSAIRFRIDSLAKTGLPKSALKLVDSLDGLARKNNNGPQQIRAVIYRMTFESYLEEDALVAIINRLKTDIDSAAYPVKPVLQSLLAQMYWNYYQQNRWRFNQRTKLEQADADFTNWDLQTIIGETGRLYGLSLRDAVKEQNTPVGVLDGVLQGDSTSRYLRPTLYDLLVQRAFDFFLAYEAGINKPQLPASLNDPRFFSDSKTFASLPIKTSDTASTYYKGLKYLQQATLFHLQNQNPDGLADLDLKRLVFLHDYSDLVNKDSLYLNAVQKTSENFSSGPISADALVLAGKYYLLKDSLATALPYFIKAATAFPKSLGGKNAANYIKIIRQKNVSAIVEDVNPPGKPLLALLSYRNIKTARVTIYKIWSTQYNELAAFTNADERYRYTNNLAPLPAVFEYLNKLKPITITDLQPPGTADYRQHNTEFKIAPLQSGIYVLIVQDTSNHDQSYLQLTTFKVCPLALVTRRNPDNNIEIRVMDRETGAPVPGVQVTMAETKHAITDNNGACFLGAADFNNYSVKLTTTKDTLYVGNRYSFNRYDLRIRNAEPVNHTIFFTDREIYRPGQIVYFKGLHLQTHNGESKLLANENLTVNVMDNNNKLFKTIPVITNAFGSFSGTFVIPQNILNGQVSVNTVNGNKFIKVEEYKRPTFTVDFLPVKNSYRLNDPVTIKGKVMAYSGYGISQAKVAYHVTRQLEIGNYQSQNFRRNIGLAFRIAEIATDTIKTDDQGQFEIKFKALPDEGEQNSDLKYRYSINADVTDGSGETRPANGQVVVANNNLTIAANVPDKVLPGEKLIISAQLNNLNGATQSGHARLKVYSLNAPGHLFKKRIWVMPDKYLLSREQYKNDFPEYAYGNEDDRETWASQRELIDLNIEADGKTPVSFSSDKLRNEPTGTYRVIISAADSRGDTTSIIKYLYWVNKPGKPQEMTGWVNVLNNNVTDGRQAKILVGAGNNNHILMEKYNGSKFLSSKWLTITGNAQRLIKVPPSPGEDNINVQFLMVYHNRLYTNRQNLINNKEDNGLDVKFLTFRNKLQPGEKEQWKLQISGRGREKQTAEMVADLYDASLDAIAAPDSWDGILNFGYGYAPGYTNWDDAFTSRVSTLSLKSSFVNFMLGERRYEHLFTFRMSYEDKVFKSVEEMPMLREVAVANPGRKNLKQKNGHIQEDTVEYNAATASVSLNGKDYPNLNATNPIALRTNFAETAFFYPQLQTNEKGEILIDFTIPEALTRWKFRGFAHTKDLHTGYIEREVVTQKQLSISANTPRFLREGDTITISARLANLSAGTLKGNVQMKLFNALNMQPVSLFVNPADAETSFEVAGNTNKAVSFRLVIPAGLDALTYRLTADAGQFTDGEENTLPVLPNRMLVTESMPMMVRAGQIRYFTFDKLVHQSSTTLQNKTLTLEYTQNPAWYAVQALPYIMEFPYECSEQIFSRYYANTLATGIVNKMPAIKQVFNQWKNSSGGELLSSLEKNQELKSTLIEETPWLNDAISESEQKKRIALLFDLNKMGDELKLNLDKLQKRQLADGGFTWFGGDRADRYITQHIAEGMGELFHLGITGDQPALKPIANNAIKYLDNQLLADENYRVKNKQEKYYSDLEIHAWYTRSFFLYIPLNSAMQKMQSDYLKWAEDNWPSRNVYEQGLIALTMQRCKKPDITTLIERSLLETAHQSDDLGMYWAQNQQGYFWYQSPVETQSLLIELFTEAGDNTKAVDEMKIWLLRNKQTNNWKTTKATAAACYALLLKGNDLLSDTGKSVIKLNGKPLEGLKPEVKADAGTGYIKTTWVDEQIKPGLGKVEISNTGKNISWGALHWQYLENLDKITSAQTNIQLERKYFIQKQTDAGPVLTAVDATHIPKTGDLLKVVVHLKADRDFEYVHLKDMRPAGTEPVEALSAYKYQDGLYYYQITKDVATSFFISNLNKGSYVFEYQLRVAQPGNFSTGITSIQCMYAPEFNAHSQGERMVVKP